MKMITHVVRHLLGTSLAMAASTTLYAQEAAPKPAPANPSSTTIEVIGSRPGDTDSRRQSTAPTLVFGREELDRQGDASVLDVMKRLPGVTLPGRPGGRGGAPQMRGMGSGYTQLLINGEPAPRGLSLDNIAPDQVERIEVTRSATAERGTRGVAGTINIVLREDIRKQRGEARAFIESEHGATGFGGMAQYSDRIDTLGYNLSANANRRHNRTANLSRTVGLDPLDGTPILDRHIDASSNAFGERANLGGRLGWRFAPGETLNLQPNLSWNANREDSSGRQTQSLGSSPPEWSNQHSRNDSKGLWWGLTGDSQHRIGSDRGELRFNLGEWRGDADSLRRDFGVADDLLRTIVNDSRSRDGRIGGSAKYSGGRRDGHTLVSGLEIEHGWRRETAHTYQNGVEVLTDAGDSFAADTQRMALFVQDDWELSTAWALNAGLRWERIRTDVNAESRRDTNTSEVLSPVLHAVWRLDEERRSQLRASLARTYRQTNLSDLIARPRPNLSFPIDGPNDATHPDRIGNPTLKPEVAWGLDVAAERFLEEGGILSANLFARRIDDLIRNVTRLETVSWSSVPRWVTRPDNLGAAWSWGIELEAKGRLNQFIDDALPIDLRFNLSRFWSRVDQVPGPNNRIDQQPEITANLGADYRFKTLPVQIGSSFNWTPAYDLRRLDGEFAGSGAKRVLEAFAVWSISPGLRLRASASNLLAEDYLSSTRRVLGGVDQTTFGTARTDTLWALRLETRL